MQMGGKNAYQPPKKSTSSLVIAICGVKNYKKLASFPSPFRINRFLPFFYKFTAGNNSDTFSLWAFLSRDRHSIALVNSFFYAKNIYHPIFLLTSKTILYFKPFFWSFHKMSDLLTSFLKSNGLLIIMHVKKHT